MAEGRVLVVDDEADVRRTIQVMLTKAGFDGVEAEDGQAESEAFRLGDKPLAVDTIICNMQMSKVNGMEAVAYFRQQFPSVPVIVFTGNPDFKDANEQKLVEAVKNAAKSHELFKDQFAT